MPAISLISLEKMEKAKFTSLQKFWRALLKIFGKKITNFEDFLLNNYFFPIFFLLFHKQMKTPMPES
jgi:hypothetical protein